MTEIDRDKYIVYLQSHRNREVELGEYLQIIDSLKILPLISKGYRPEARGYVIYSPCALPEGNNHELKDDKRLIFTLARIPQRMQNIVTKNASIVHLSFVF